jgi:hypothetical protein
VGCLAGERLLAKTAEAIGEPKPKFKQKNGLYFLFRPT